MGIDENSKTMLHYLKEFRIDHEEDSESDHDKSKKDNA